MARPVLDRAEKRRQRDILAIAEAMACEGGQAVDILVGLEHLARVEYQQQGDVLRVDTQAGYWEA